MTEEGTVRRRPLLAIPGWLLFGCLFLPTLQVCSDPVRPIEFPPSYVVYIGGLVIGLLGGARLLRSRRRALIVLMSLWTFTAFAILSLFAGSAMAGVGVFMFLLFVVVQTYLTRSMVRTEWTERGIAIGCFVHALIATGWSALLAFSSDGLWGAHVAFWAGIAMMVTSAGMIASAHHEMIGETEPAQLPEARAIVRG